VPFTLDSRVTNTTREYAHLLDDVVKGRRPGACPRRLPLPELGRARLHSRSEVGRYVVDHYFQRRLNKSHSKPQKRRKHNLPLVSRD
jgi:hypothetical protein